MRRWLGTLGQDLGYAIRSFRRSPAFVLVALLSLTLGIGATSAIFSVIYGVLIAPYPYARPGDIWAPEVRAVDGRGGHGYSLDELRALTEVPAFADVMATSMETVLMTGEFAPESFGGVLLSGNAFNFLGVPPVIGRTIQPTDIRSDGQADPVVVLSHRLWLRLFEGSPSAVGQTLRLNGRPHTIVGVMPPRFGWYGNDGFWLPLSPTRTDIPWISPIVRLAPGVSNGRRRGAARRAQSAAGPGEAGDVSETGVHDQAPELPGRDRRERRDADEPAAAARRGRVPAAHRVRQRRQSAAGARHCAGARDGGPDVDWRRSPPAGAPTADRKCAALARRRSLRRAVRVRRHPVHRRADARVLRAQRVAGRGQPARAGLLAGGFGAHRHPVRPRAGPADVEVRHHGRAQGRAQDRCRNAGRPHAQPAGGHRSRAVGRAARQRGPDRPHVLRPPEHGRWNQRRSRAARGRATAAGQVRDARRTQPFRRGTAGPRWRAPRGRGRHARASVRQPAIAIHDRGTPA